MRLYFAESRQAFDGLCVTDHEHMGMRRLAEQLTSRYDFLVLVGMEFLTFEGDFWYSVLTGSRIGAMHAMNLSPLSTVRRLRHKCTPLSGQRQGQLGNEIRGLLAPHGLEAVNGSTSSVRITTYGIGSCIRTSGLARLGGSDAHLPSVWARVRHGFLNP